jgi:hypothetical protein
MGTLPSKHMISSASTTPKKPVLSTGKNWRPEAVCELITKGKKKQR